MMRLNDSESLACQLLGGRRPTESEALMVILAIEKLQEVMDRLHYNGVLPEKEVN